VRASDRLIGIVLGILLGLAIVIAFVFLGSRDTIDAPSLSGGESQTQGTTPSTTTKPSP
jgi:hypothetical protein